MYTKQHDFAIKTIRFCSFKKQSHIIILHTDVSVDCIGINSSVMTNAYASKCACKCRSEMFGTFGFECVPPTFALVYDP